MAYDSPQSGRRPDARSTRPTAQAPSLRPDATTASNQGTEQAREALWQAVHERLGNRSVALSLGAGPKDAFDLLILQMVDFQERTGHDVVPLLPWNAPLSWNDTVGSLAESLWQVWPATAPAPDLLGPALDVDSDTSGQDTGTGSGSDSSGDAGFIGVSGGDLAGEALSRDVAGQGAVGDDIGGEIDRLLTAAGGGQPLSEKEQGLLEAMHGRRFPEIRVHRGSAAEQAGQLISARAFTIGSDIFMSEGSGRADTPAGAELLVHEATHVKQAAEGRLPSARGDGMQVSTPNQPHEREAERIGLQARASFHELNRDLAAPQDDQAQTAPAQATPAQEAQIEGEEGGETGAELAADLGGLDADDGAIMNQTMGELDPMGAAGAALIDHMQGQIAAFGADGGEGMISRRAGSPGQERPKPNEQRAEQVAQQQNTTDGELRESSNPPQPGNAPEHADSDVGPAARGLEVADALNQTRERVGTGLFESVFEKEDGFVRLEALQSKLGGDLLAHLSSGREGNPDRFLDESEQLSSMNDAARSGIHALLGDGDMDVGDSFLLANVLPSDKLNDLADSEDKGVTSRLVEVAKNLGDQAQATLSSFTESLGDTAAPVLHDLLTGAGAIGAESLGYLREQGIKPALLGQLAQGMPGTDIEDAVTNLGGDFVSNMGANLGNAALNTLSQAGLDRQQVASLANKVAPDSLRTMLEGGIAGDAAASLIDALPTGAMESWLHNGLRPSDLGPLQDMATGGDLSGLLEGTPPSTLATLTRDLGGDALRALSTQKHLPDGWMEVMGSVATEATKVAELASPGNSDVLQQLTGLAGQTGLPDMLSQVPLDQISQVVSQPGLKPDDMPHVLDTFHTVGAKGFNALSNVMGGREMAAMQTKAPASAIKAAGAQTARQANSKPAGPAQAKPAAPPAQAKPAAAPASQAAKPSSKPSRSRNKSRSKGRGKSRGGRGGRGGRGRR